MNFAIFATGILFLTVNGIEIIPPKYALHPFIAQHLGQDGLGRYTYGYVTPTSTKSESKGIDGVIRGGYSYLDPKGHLQTVQYVADPLHGFLVAASNLPQDVPSVAFERQRHLLRYEAIKAEHAAIALSKLQQTIPVEGAPVDPAVLPQDIPSVAYAKQRHLEKYEAIKAQHASLALAAHDPHAAVILPNPVHDLPAVAHAKAQHLAAFEAVKARDLTAKIAAENEALKSGVHLTDNVDVNSYTPIIPTNSLQYYSYGYVHPAASHGLINHPVEQGYSYLDTNGILKAFNYIPS